MGKRRRSQTDPPQALRSGGFGAGAASQRQAMPSWPAETRRSPVGEKGGAQTDSLWPLAAAGSAPEARPRGGRYHRRQRRQGQSPAGEKAALRAGLPALTAAGSAPEARPRGGGDAIVASGRQGGRQWGKGGAQDRPTYGPRSGVPGAGGASQRRSVPSWPAETGGRRWGERRRSGPTPAGPSQRRSSAPEAASQKAERAIVAGGDEAVAGGGKRRSGPTRLGPRSGRFGAGGGVPEAERAIVAGGDEAVAGGGKGGAIHPPTWPRGTGLGAAGGNGAGRRSGRPERGAGGGGSGSCGVPRAPARRAVQIGPGQVGGRGR